ncbi:early light-inducible protein [Scenedesmus sp. NREL 46B-D3]|nr:early light-inducible protein [Scenedesmus sp. NREL 46B-D3]
MDRKFSPSICLRPLRAVETEQASTAADESQKVEATISALDSLLPPQQRPEPPAASSSTPASSSPAKSSSSSSSPWGALPAAAASSSSSKAPASVKQQQSFDAVMGFDGLAPELINGRAAMLGFVAAVMAETRGDSLFSQLLAGGFQSALVVIALVTLASFAPAVRQVFGKDKAPASFGPFTPTAELINGRAAMLGLAALFFIEGTSGQPFFL